MLRSVPSWLFYMNQSDFIGSVAYHLTFTIFETLLVFIIVLAMGSLIPRRWAPEPFITLSSVLIVELSIMAIIFQQLVLEYSSLRWMSVACLMILAVTIVIVPKITVLQKISRLVAERLTILTFLYVLFDIFGVAIVILRNL
jgi:hypothetical protein